MCEDMCSPLLCVCVGGRLYSPGVPVGLLWRGSSRAPPPWMSHCYPTMKRGCPPPPQLGCGGTAVAVTSIPLWSKVGPLL